MSVAYDDIRNLPLPELSVQLLRSFGDQPNFNTLIRSFEQRGGYGEPQPHGLATMKSRLSDAWAWLLSHGLIGPSSQNPGGELVPAHHRGAGGRRRRQCNCEGVG